jgi:hypothetical protein
MKIRNPVIIATYSLGEFQRLTGTNREICLTADGPNSLIVGLDRSAHSEQPVAEA